MLSLINFLDMLRDAELHYSAIGSTKVRATFWLVSGGFPVLQLNGYSPTGRPEGDWLVTRTLPPAVLASDIALRSFIEKAFQEGAKHVRT